VTRNNKEIMRGYPANRLGIAKGNTWWGEDMRGAIL